MKSLQILNESPLDFVHIFPLLFIGKSFVEVFSLKCRGIYIFKKITKYFPLKFKGCYLFLHNSVGCGHTSQQVLQRSLVNKQQSIFCRQYFVGYRTIVKEEVWKRNFYYYNTEYKITFRFVVKFLSFNLNQFCCSIFAQFECLSKLI